MTVGMKMSANPIADAEKCDCLACTLRATFYRYRQKHNPNPEIELHDLARFVGEVIGENSPDKGRAAMRVAEHHMTALDYAIVDEETMQATVVEDVDALAQVLESALMQPEDMPEPTEREIDLLTAREIKSRGRLN